MSGRRRGAFTLVELLVVVAIIALLVGLLMPSLQRAKELTRRAMCLHNLKSLVTAANIYAEDFDGTYPTYKQWADNPALLNKYFLPYNTRNVFNGQIRDPDGDLVPLNLCMVWEQQLLPDPRIFYCPSQPFNYYHYDRYPQPFDKSNRTLPGYWRTAYMYSPHVVGYLRAYTHKTTFPPRKILLTDILNQEKSVAHWDTADRPGWNIAFPNGGARYQVSEKALSLIRRTGSLGNSWTQFSEARNVLEGDDGP